MTVLIFKEKKKCYGCFTNLYSYQYTRFSNLHDYDSAYL